MSTTFTAMRVTRQVTADMFIDLGYPVITFTILHPFGMQIDLVEDLNAAQIQRAKIRIATRNTEQEAMLVAGMGALDSLDTYLAIPSPSNAQAILMVRTLALDMRALIKWIGKDVLAP